MMLDNVLNDPLTSLYFMSGMPSLETINKTSAKGAIFLSVSEKLANIHNQKNYPPFFLTFHDIAHADAVSKNKHKIIEQLKIKTPSVQEYIQARNEIQDFLAQLYKFESEVPKEQKDLFEAFYNSLTHDFVENLYHHPIRLKNIIENFDRFMDFRKITIHRSLMIYQEAEGRDVTLKEMEEMESIFDQFMARNMNLIR